VLCCCSLAELHRTYQLLGVAHHESAGAASAAPAAWQLLQGWLCQQIVVCWACRGLQRSSCSAVWLWHNSEMFLAHDGWRLKVLLHQACST
jgi:hypothetical protein